MKLPKPLFIILLSSFILLFSPLDLQAKIKSLKFIGDLNFKTGFLFKKIEMGGLSGLAYHKKNETLYAVSDDRSKFSPARIYAFKLKLLQNSFNVVPKKIIFLKNKKGKFYKKGSVDFEGIQILENGNFALSSEGDRNKLPTMPPTIMEFDQTGKFIRKYKLPTKLEKGHLFNASLESLTSSFDKKYLYSMTESPLINDLSKKRGHLSLRLYSFKKSRDHFYYPSSEYIYPIKSKSLNPKKFNGVSDILYLSQDEFLVMERSYHKKKNKNVLNIFLATKTKGATNVEKIQSLDQHNGPLVTLQKKMLVSLGQYTKNFKFGYQYLDNIEGICFGPKLKNGNQTLLFVSDNNFSKKQRTLFLAFEIIEVPSKTAPQKKN